MYITMLIIGCLLLLAALIFTFMPRAYAACAAWLSLLCFHIGGIAAEGWPTLIFWGVAALIVLGIAALQGAPTMRSNRAANAYIAAGALVGTIVGMMISSAGLIIGSVAGAFFGALAFSRTPGGRAISFPSRQFLGLLTKLGLPAVIATCITGLALASILVP